MDIGSAFGTIFGTPMSTDTGPLIRRILTISHMKHHVFEDSMGSRDLVRVVKGAVSLASLERLIVDVGFLRLC